MSPPVIYTRNLRKAFGSKKVLNGLNMELLEGENVVVLGRSGTGKSVFIKCLVNLIEPDEGEIKILGKNLLALNDRELDELRKEVGFVFQNSALYDSMSVRDNLAFPLRRNKLSEKEVEDRIREALENVNLLDAIDKMPSELSGGMRKRIGLARTLIMRPRIMLYDEPTTGLDVITSREISELILDIRKKYKTSSIIITHDMACARITGDRIVMLHEGQFISEGTYDELKQSEHALVKGFFEDEV